MRRGWIPISIVIGGIACTLGLGAALMRQPALKPGPELSFLYEIDPNPRYNAVSAPRYGPHGVYSATPELRFEAGADTRAVAHKLKALRGTGWRVEFPVDRSYHAECSRGSEKLQFYAMHAPNAFILYRDQRVKSPEWLVSIYGFFQRFRH